MFKSLTRQRVVLLIVIIASIALVSYNQYRNQTNEQSGQVLSESTRPLKIGSILPLTGDLAILGDEINRGAMLALKEARNSGEKIEYTAEDDHFEAKGAANAANKLTRIGKVDVVFTAAVQEAKPIASTFNESKTPLLVTWDSNEFLNTAGPYIFATGFSTEQAGRDMAKYAWEKGIKSAAILKVKDEWSELISDAFNKEWVSLGGKVSFNEAVGVDETDFRTLLIKIKIAKVDAIYFPLFPGHYLPFLNQARELGVNTTLLTGDGFQQAQVDLLGNLAEGIVNTNVYGENLEQLAEKYETAYGSKPLELAFVGFGYDAVNTIRSAKKIATEKQITLTEALPLVKISGSVGEIDFNGTRFSEKREKLFIIERGKFVEVSLN